MEISSEKRKKASGSSNPLLATLKEQKEMGLKGSI